MDLSIIIPVYNTPVPVLRRCLSSVEAIVDVSFEVLLVDDGSKEETATFCNEYAATHPFIRCFHKKNGGVSSARNMGLEAAQGDYVLFVDGDDEVLADAFTMPLEGDLILYDALVQNGDAQKLVPTLSEAAPDRDVLLKKLVTLQSIG